MTRKKTISKILELKGMTKEQLELDAKKTRDELDIERQRLDLLDSALSDTVGDFTRKQQGGTINTQELEIFYNYLLHLNRCIDQQKEIVDEKLAELEIKQKAILEAYKEKRLFEILHEKILHREMKESLSVEQKEVDFTYISRRSRR